VPLEFDPQPPAWDAPDRTPAQESFYRELMARDELPSAPEVAQRMLVAANREDANARHLADVIARDPPLTARLLRLANSAFFASRAPVTSIPQAITLLGFARVRSMGLGLSVWGALAGRSASERRYRRILWTHSALVAAAARTLAERSGLDADSAFAAGLLHDVGKLVLGLRLGESYWALLDAAAEQEVPATIFEDDSFGCHHGTVGGWLLQLWQLPAELVDPVALHHGPLSRDGGLDVAATVALANCLVDATDLETGDVRDEVVAEVQGFAPGLPGTEAWGAMYASIAREQAAVADLFEDTPQPGGRPRASSARARAQR
jgi:putative nucleotidyltransferase with HDIG domain